MREVGRGTRCLQVPATAGDHHAGGGHALQRVEHAGGAIVEGVVVGAAHHVDARPCELVGDPGARRQMHAAIVRLGVASEVVQRQLEVHQSDVRAADGADERPEPGIGIVGPGLGDDRITGQEERETAVRDGRRSPVERLARPCPDERTTVQVRVRPPRTRLTPLAVTVIAGDGQVRSRTRT